MFEKFFSADATNFRQRYEQTYGFFTDGKGKRILSRIEHINLEESPKYVSFKDVRGIEFKLNADADGDVGFEFLPPNSAFYNTEDGIFYVQRRAARQFQRGVSSNNVVIYNLSQGIFQTTSVNFKSLSPIYEKEIKFSTAKEKYDKDENLALAISHSFLITKDRLVRLYVDVIGNYKLNNGVYSITLNKGMEIFHTELQDAFQRVNMFNVEIKNHGKT